MTVRRLNRNTYELFDDGVLLGRCVVDRFTTLLIRYQPQCERRTVRETLTHDRAQSLLAAFVREPRHGQPQPDPLAQILGVV